ncbi:alpha/beta fold hydrolase [Listeria ilorinensis]|uniref:alpha/beta fold hydrolase n=1 Tax=Listeria ilorinensis TaxID=2867439 RepID=UPI001EF47E6B|nr:alpha/beta hydrolase [Listeria ilorinensis]
MYDQINGVNLYYDRIGTGMPIIMLHGFGPDSELMKGCMEPIFNEESPFERIYIDLPGMGKTENYEAVRSADDMLKLLLAFIHKNLPEQDFLLAGESYGGYLARGILSQLTIRVKGLLQICPVIHPEREKRTLPKQQIIYQDEQLMESLSADEQTEFIENGVVLTAKNWRRLISEVLPGLITADHDHLRIYEQRYALSFNPDDQPPFTHPSLFLFGRQDSVVGYRDGLALLERYPRASFAILDGAGHNLQIEEEKVFNELVTDWLNRFSYLD